MLQNFFKVAFRNITRHKGFATINIAGLALGLTACILIGVFVWDENQYDKFVKDGDRVYRVCNEYSNNEGSDLRAVAPPMFATSLKKEYPEVEQVARVMMQAKYKMLFEVGEKKLYEENGFFADSTFFEVLPLNFKYGTIQKALDERSAIVISEQMSERFFAKQDPVGKQMIVEGNPVVVKGVFVKDPRFHLQFDYLRPLATIQLPEERMKSWGWQQFFNYVKLKKGADVKSLEAKFRPYVAEKSQAFTKDAQIRNKPFFQPLKKIHLYSANLKFDMAERGNITYVNALLIIAVFVLLIACFNFVNLATAKSLQRAKEVGVRKTIGADKKQLIFHFIGETLLLTFISLGIAIALSIIVLPWMNQFTGKQISMTLFVHPVTISLLLGVSLIVGLLAGFYPALVLSSFKPVKVLKSALSNAMEAGKIPLLRKGLVVLQFTLSVLLIISALVVFKQVDYLHHKDLGFNKDQIMFFPMRGDSMSRNSQAFKNDLLKTPGVRAVSIGYGFPGDAVAGDQIIVPKNGENVELSATLLMVDFDYIKTLGLQVVAGRDFSKEMKTDADKAFIINETAVKQLGFGTPEKALGQTLKWPVWGATNPDSLKIGSVIGVVKDFNYKSLYDKMETAILQIFPDAAWKVAVKINSAGLSNTISSVEQVWNRFSPDSPIEYKFLDENFQQMYISEDKLQTLLAIFTSLAILIGCLGLFGLAAYAAERRRKEIGIRKVLGASVQGLILMLSKDFVKLVMISLVVATPIAWYFMNKWLQDFAFRIHISGWIFVIAAIVAIGIAFITVSFQAVKAAMSNPVKSLRTE